MTLEQMAILGRTANGLGKLLPVDQLADLLNAIVGADAEPRLTDPEVEALETLFALLRDLSPEAVDVAMKR